MKYFRRAIYIGIVEIMSFANHVPLNYKYGKNLLRGGAGAGIDVFYQSSTHYTPVNLLKILTPTMPEFKIIQFKPEK